MCGGHWRPSVDREGFTAHDLVYLDGVLADGDLQPLCRLRYEGSATYWGFAIYLASKDGYRDSVLPSGAFEGTPQEALDCACGLHLQP